MLNILSSSGASGAQPSSGYKDRFVRLNMLPLSYWLELQDAVFLVVYQLPSTISIKETIHLFLYRIWQICLHKFSEAQVLPHFHLQTFLFLQNSEVLECTSTHPPVSFYHYSLTQDVQNHSYHFRCPCSNCFFVLFHITIT